MISNTVKLCSIKCFINFNNLVRLLCVCVHISTSAESLGTRLGMKIEAIVNWCTNWMYSEKYVALWHPLHTGTRTPWSRGWGGEQARGCSEQNKRFQSQHVRGTRHSTFQAPPHCSREGPGAQCTDKVRSSICWICVMPGKEELGSLEGRGCLGTRARMRVTSRNKTDLPSEWNA